MAKKLYVGNLSYSVNEDKLREIFSEFGSVASATIITDRDSGRSKGFGFVEMGSDDETQAAMTALNGKEVEGRQLKVNEAREKSDSRGDRGGRGGSRGGGGGFKRDRY